MSEQQMTFALGSKRDIASYAISLVAGGNGVSLPEVSRKLRFASVVIVTSLVLTVGLFALIRLGPDMGEATPFVALIWLAFAALFVYSLVAYTVLVITALTVQHVRIAENDIDLSAISEDLERLRAIVKVSYERDPRLLTQVAAEQGAQAEKALMNAAQQ